MEIRSKEDILNALLKGDERDKAQRIKGQKAHYDAFWQFDKFSDGEPIHLENKGLHQILNSIFPLQTGKVKITYNGYDVESCNLTERECLEQNKPYGVKIRLNLMIDGALDINDIERFKRYIFYLRYRELDAVPMLTENGYFILKSKSGKGIIKSPIYHLGLIDDSTKISDPSKCYSLANMRIYLLTDYLQREINKCLKAFRSYLEHNQTINYNNVIKSICSFILMPLYKALDNSRICKVLDLGNPINMISQLDEVSHIGPFGLKGKKSPTHRRHAHHSHYGRLCVLETPESESIGLTLHLAKGADIVDQEILSKYKDSKALNSEGDDTAIIGSFYDTDRDGFVLGKLAEEISYFNKEKIKYWDSLPNQFLGSSASLIPFIAYNDPARATMGAKNMKQAVILKEPEYPLVRNISDKEIEEKTGVPMKMGKNMLVAYMSWFGYNYEDGIVVSQRASVELASVKQHEPTIIPVMGDEKPYCNLEKIKGRCILAEDGIVCKGMNVQTGDVICRIHKVKPFLNSQVIIDKFREERVPKYIKGIVKQSEYISYYDDNLELSPDTLRGIVKIVIEDDRPLEVGDKLTGRHGNKGVVSLILPESEMPYFIDPFGMKDIKGSPDYHGEDRPHRHVEIILNPHGVISRMNLGQLMETHVGLVIQRNKESNFNKEWLHFEKVDTDRLSRELEQTGIVNSRGKTRLFYCKNGKNIEIENECLVGYQYILKLDHMVEDKYHARAEGPTSTITGQPTKGRGNNGGMRLGEMEVWALKAHGAFGVLEELIFDKSDRIENQIRSLDAFKMYLRGLGINLIFYDQNDRTVSHNKGAKAQISFADKKTILQWSNGSVSKRANPNIITTEKGKALSIAFNEDGILSPKVFGINEVNRFWKKDKLTKDIGTLMMGHIELSEPVINPLSYKVSYDGLNREVKDLFTPPKRTITKVNKEGIIKTGKRKQLLVLKSEVNDIKAGHVISVNDYKIHCGRIEVCDTTELIINFESLKKQYPEALKGIDTIPQMPILECLPVIPVSLRPYIFSEASREIILGDLNNLYSDVITANNQLLNTKKRFSQGQCPHSEVFIIKERLEIAVNELLLYGRIDTNTKKSLLSIVDILRGKGGLIRKYMLGKRCNYSARSVIVPDPYIALDEIVIPYEIATTLFHNNIYLKTLAEGETLPIENTHVIFTRAPSLHKYSVMAFRPTVKRGLKSIKINPAVCKPFNADFDGDQMSIFAIDNALSLKEAEERLVPQKNLLGVANGDLLVTMSLDIKLGLYLMKQSEEGRKILIKLFGDSDIESCIKDAIHNGSPEDIKGRIERLMRSAFEYASNYGISFGIFDLLELTLSDEEIKDVFEDYIAEFGYNGIKTNNEKFIDFDRRRSYIEGNLKELLQEKLKRYPNNPISVIYHSGAKKDDRQIMQLIGAKGFVEYPVGDEVLAPVLSNYCKGLHPFEFFVSTFKSRDTVMDKKLKTAPSGYLTRRLVSAGYEIVISGKEPCNDKDGLEVKIDKGKSYNWLIGRFLIEIDEGGNPIYIDREKLEAIINDAKPIRYRSPITCKNEKGICPFCYGIDLSKNRLPEEGLSVGIIAGQSIGERSTQLSMRSYHTGASAGLVRDFKDIEDGFDSSKMAKQSALFNSDKLEILVDKFKVDRKHFEVILRATNNGQMTIRNVAINQPNVLSAASFAWAIDILAKAAFENKIFPIDGLKDRLLTGGGYHEV